VRAGPDRDRRRFAGRAAARDLPGIPRQHERRTRPGSRRMTCSSPNARTLPTARGTTRRSASNASFTRATGLNRVRSSCPDPDETRARRDCRIGPRAAQLSTPLPLRAMSSSAGSGAELVAAETAPYRSQGEPGAQRTYRIERYLVIRRSSTSVVPDEFGAERAGGARTRIRPRRRGPRSAPDRQPPGRP
jgi:hypothetical protein